VVGGAVLGATAIAGVLSATGSPAAARSGAGGPLRDGAWSGLMAVGATLDLSTGDVDLVAMADGSGTFSLVLAGGNAGGDYQLGASSQAALDAGTSTGFASAVGAITGTVTGTATAPVLAPQQGHFDIVGSVIVDGFESPFSVSTDLGPGELTASTITITSSSCTVASGTWAEEFAAAAAAGGAKVTAFQGSWTATFLGNEPGTGEAALAELLERGEAVISTWLSSGAFDAAAMEQVLVDAEHAAIAGPTNDTCSRDHRSSWASPLAGMVERLLTAMAHSSSTTAEVLRFGVAAGLRTGVLPSIDGPVEADLLAKATDVLAAEVAAGDPTGIALIAVAADSMGWTELSAAAAEALGG
jgi:hypothetical protein